MWQIADASHSSSTDGWMGTRRVAGSAASTAAAAGATAVSTAMAPPEEGAAWTEAAVVTAGSWVARVAAAT